MLDSRPFRLKMRLCLAGALAGLAVLVGTAILHDRLPGAASGVMMTLGMGSFLVLAGLAFGHGFDARVRDRVARGEGVLARWTVDAPTWQAVLALPGMAGNALKLAPTAPPAGVEVAICTHAILVGPHYQPLSPVPAHTVVTVHAGWMEFIVGSEAGEHPVRVPIAQGAAPQARAAARYFQAPPRP